MKPAKQPPPSSSSVKQALLGLYGIVGVSISTFGPFKIPFAESHAKDYWRHAVAGIILVLFIITGIISLAIYMFDANYFKSQMVDYVKTHTQRDLTLDGDIKVTFFPQLGLDSGKMSLSQRNSSKRFASIDNTHFNIAWWPLVRKQLQIERVTLEGVHANVILYKDGSTNFDDLFATDGSVSDITFEIDSIKLKNSSANLQDEMSGMLFSLHGLNMATGKLSESTPGEVTANFRLESTKPHIDTQVKLNSHFLLELKSKHYEFANFDITMEGEIAGINNIALNLQGTLNSYSPTNRLTIDKLIAHAKGKLDNRKVEAKLDIPKLQLLNNKLSGNTLVFNTNLLQEGENLTASLELPAFELVAKKFKSENMLANLDLFSAGRTLQGKLNSPVNIDFETMQMQFSAITGNFSGTHPQLVGKLNASLTGSVQANLPEKMIKISLKAKIDDSDLTASVDMQDFSHPAYTFDINANTLDLDRYLAADWGKRFQDVALPLDFSAFRELKLRGKFRSSAFKFASFKFSNFVADIRADQSSFNIDLLNARLYGGTMQGSLSISANEIAAINFKQKLAGIQINSMLADTFAGEAKLSGKGNLTIDLNATGQNMGAMRKSLQGSVSLALGRGSLAGINLAEALLAGKSQLGVKDSEKNEAAKFTTTTSFSELKSTFEINEGKIKSSDFLMNSPFFSVKGEGDILFESGQLNYILNTAIAPNLKRSSAGELAELKGVNIPMFISGPYATPSIKLDFGNASGMQAPKPLPVPQAKPALSPARKNKPEKNNG